LHDSSLESLFGQGNGDIYLLYRFIALSGSQLRKPESHGKPVHGESILL